LGKATATLTAAFFDARRAAESSAFSSFATVRSPAGPSPTSSTRPAATPGASGSSTASPGFSGRSPDSRSRDTVPPSDSSSAESSAVNSSD